MHVASAEVYVILTPPSNKNMSGKASINLQKPCKTYSPGETIVGSLEIETGGSEVTHEGVELSLEGQITLLRPKIR